MISGIFFVEFFSSMNDAGRGLAVVTDGQINGGDVTYLYRGRIDVYGGQAVANIEVTHYRGELNSVFGPLRSFRLNLAGKVEVDGLSFDLGGGVQGIPGTVIRIVGKKVAELYDSTD